MRGGSPWCFVPPKLLMFAVAALLSDHCEEWSINPAYEERDLVSDPRLPGRWYGGDSSDGYWVIDTAHGDEYRLILVDDDDTTRYRLHLARAEGLLIADLLRVLDYDLEALPLHQYAVLELADSVLVYSALKDEWLKPYLDAHPKELAFEVVDGAHVITAKPHAIQRFLRRHRSDSAAWLSDTVSRTPPDD